MPANNPSRISRPNLSALLFVIPRNDFLIESPFGNLINAPSFAVNENFTPAPPAIVFNESLKICKLNSDALVLTTAFANAGVTSTVLIDERIPAGNAFSICAVANSACILATPSETSCISLVDLTSHFFKLAFVCNNKERKRDAVYFG